MIFYSALFAFQKAEAKFDVRYGMFHMGETEAHIEKNGDSYTINLSVRTVGFAKFLSANRRESYTSEGIIQSDGTLRPNHFKKEVLSNTKEDISDYKFYDANATVTRHKLLRRKDYQSANQGWRTDRDEMSEIPLFSHNDTMSLFFNLANYMDEFDVNGTIYKAPIDLGEKKIEITKLQGSELESAKKLLQEENGTFLKVIVNQKIFSSDKGELILALDEDMLCKKAILKDVLLFGDIVGEMTYKKLN